MNAATPHATVEEVRVLEAMLAARSYLYTLFHKSFGGAPTIELLEALASEATAEAFDTLAAENPFLAALRDDLTQLVPNEATLDAAKDEFTRLFIGPGAPEAYPWESVYVSHQPSVCQESTLAVREAYRESGLQAKKYLRVPDDHVSLMCAFLAKGSESAAASLRAYAPERLGASLRAQESFLLNHMANWLPAYAEAAKQRQGALVYPQLIEALSEFVKIDAVFLSESANWAETADFRDREGAGEPDEVLQAFLERYEELKRITLLGLEENELIEVAA